MESEKRNLVYACVFFNEGYVKLVELLGTYILAWIEGVELTQEVIDKMNSTLEPYDTVKTKDNILSIFTSIVNKRLESIESALTKLKQEETV